MPGRVQHLVVDTNAFINGADIANIGDNVYTIQEVIDEVTCRKQLRHLSVLAYELIVKDVFPENVRFVTDFSKKSGDYASLSAVDIKVVALAYQLEKEKVGDGHHLKTSPTVQRGVVLDTPPGGTGKFPGFFQKVDDEPEEGSDSSDGELEELQEGLKNLGVTEEDPESNILVAVKDDDDKEASSKSNVDEKDITDENSDDDSDESEDSDDGEWITVGNIANAKKTADDGFTSDESVVVSCITADFAMQNVLKQIGLNVTAYDGKLIRRVRTFILRCYACFKTTSVMTKQFCPNCGNPTLKRVAVTLDENGQRHIFINTRKPLTGRGKRFSLPAPKGGHHAQNPILNADQQMTKHRPTKLARTKNNPLNPDFIAGFSPFVMRDVNSKSAVLGIRNNSDVKNWMRKNPNEVRRKKR